MVRGNVMKKDLKILSFSLIVAACFLVSLASTINAFMLNKEVDSLKQELGINQDSKRENSTVELRKTTDENTTKIKEQYIPYNKSNLTDKAHLKNNIDNYQDRCYISCRTYVIRFKLERGADFQRIFSPLSDSGRKSFWIPCDDRVAWRGGLSW